MPSPPETLAFVVSDGHLGDSVLHALAAGTELPRVTLPDLATLNADDPAVAGLSRKATAQSTGRLLLSDSTWRAAWAWPRH